MNLADVMTEIAETADTIAGLRVHDHAARVAYPPVLFVPLPVVTFDETYQRGMDRHEFDLVLAVGAWESREATREAGEYAAGAGSKSIKATFEAHTWTSCDDLVIVSVEFRPVKIGPTEYMGAVFETVAVGPGSM